jgi:hypothetical protein
MFQREFIEKTFKGHLQVLSQEYWQLGQMPEIQYALALDGHPVQYTFFSKVLVIQGKR